jgi:hypothetical protein
VRLFLNNRQENDSVYPSSVHMFGRVILKIVHINSIFLGCEKISFTGLNALKYPFVQSKPKLLCDTNETIIVHQRFLRFAQNRVGSSSI